MSDTRTRSHHASPSDETGGPQPGQDSPRGGGESQGAALDGLLLGVDIGGTKTMAAVSRVSEPLDPVWTARAGSANVQNVTHAEARRAVQEIAEQLESAIASGDPGWRQRLAGVVVGSGGVDTPQDAEIVRGLVAQGLGIDDAAVEVVHDTRLIIAAAEHDAGISLILGTGSVAWGSTPEGLTARAGGWGYLLGDEGSAYWFGREAVRAALRAEETDTLDPLAGLVCEAAGVQRPAELIAAFYNDPSRTRWAGLARCVFEAAASEDEPSQAALDIIDEGVELAARDVVQVADRLGVEGPVVCGGGLIQNQAGFAQALRERLAGEGIEPLTVLTREPVVGALYLAAGRAQAVA